jgi:hypothetical protein
VEELGLNYEVTGGLSCTFESDKVVSTRVSRKNLVEAKA